MHRRDHVAGGTALIVAGLVVAALLLTSLPSAPTLAQDSFVSTPVVAATPAPWGTPDPVVATPPAPILDDDSGLFIWPVTLRAIGIPAAFIAETGQFRTQSNPRIDAWAGDVVRMTLTNASGRPQSFAVPALNILSPIVPPGESITFDFIPTTVGEFEYESGDPALAEAGMRGILRVAGVIEVGSRVGDIFSAAEATIEVCEATPEVTPPAP